MKLKSILFFSLCLFINQSFAQNQNWTARPGENRVMIENKGQFKIQTSENFNNDVKFSFDGETEDFYFTPSGVVFEFWTKEKRIKSDEEKAARKAQKEKGFATRAEFEEFERVGQKLLIKHDVIEAEWIGANENVQILAEDENSFYHNYQYYGKDKKLEFAYDLRSYNKLTYKNIYPNIDVVYEIHKESGLKYSVIVHPGGDISKVKLKYSKDIVLNEDGTIHTSTKFGDMIDHAPITFYEDDKFKKVSSKYLVSGNTISFLIGKYDNSKTLIIDPWSQSPTFATNWDCVWECERDGTGNVYIVGGIMPMQLLKYNAGGTLQWTHNTPFDTSNVWLGTFATDNAGNSYVTAGSVAQIQKINAAGVVQFTNTNPGGIFTSTEFWNISFNCDQTKLIIGGTGGFLPPLPYVYDVNMSNGNILNSVQVTGGQLIPTQEVRSITACGNGKYYYLTHDSLGYIHQSLNACSASGSPVTNNSNGYSLGYKCENYRYDNSGIMAIRYYGGFIFTHRGNQLHKRDFNTGAILATAAIPGGQFNTGFGGNNVGCSGLDIDDCGNIYVGSTNGVYRFNQAMTNTASYPTTFNVYDVTVNVAGDIIACGSTGNSGSGTRTGSVQVFSVTACAPIAITCCDATICTPPIFCTTDPATAISSTTAGGTWSASCGTCINATTGVFNPATSGAGNFTVTYTLACGSETVDVNVYTCTPMVACLESNGSITVSGGNGPFNWSEYLPGGTVPITNATECTSCDPSYTWSGLTNSCMDGLFPVANCTIAAGYYPLGTGTNVTPGTNFPIQIIDATGQTLTINSTASLSPCTACPTLTLTPASIVHVNCFGQSTGSFSISTTGGTGPYDYTLMLGAATIGTFNNVAGSQAFSNLAAGTYTVNVVDNAGCPGTINVVINQNPAITVSQTSLTPATCGLNNGSVTVNATGGSGAITYSWNTIPVQTGATASGLAAGGYIVTATDALGCTGTLNVTMTSSGGPTVTIGSPVNPTCNNGTNGTATATVTGGTGTITYSWSPTGGTSATGTSLSGGVLYTVTVTDGSGCQNTATITLTNPSAITITTSSTDATCGLSDGTLSAVGSGGTGTLDYSWNTTPVQNIANATGVPAGNYTVTVTDDNGCTATASESVNNTGAPTLSLVSQTDLDCNGDTDGTATVSGSGGTGTLTYSWNTNPVQTGTTASNLPGGTYIVTVTDGSGCSSTLNITIAEPTPVTGIVTTTNSSCATDDGTATVVASGGDGSYTYLWSNNGTTSTINGLAPGNYNVTITDGNGCTSTASGTVGTITAASIDAGLDVTIVSGTSTTLNATGGITYLWTPSDSLSCTNCASPDANPSQTTTYYVTGTDANGCVGTDSVTVFVEDPCGELWVPTAFSPNNDNSNELLCVYGGCILNMTFQLFDRWGEIVFETTANNLCWDGNYKGKPMNSAVFAYYLIATLDNGEVVEMNGNITLVR